MSSALRRSQTEWLLPYYAGHEPSEANTTADPVDLGVQSDLTGAPEPMSIEAVLAAPNGGYVRSHGRQRRGRRHDHP
jgi:hypothetical protein